MGLWNRPNIYFVLLSAMILSACTPPTPTILQDSGDQLETQYSNGLTFATSCASLYANMASAYIVVNGLHQFEILEEHESSDNSQINSTTVLDYPAPVSPDYTVNISSSHTAGGSRSPRGIYDFWWPDKHIQVRNSLIFAKSSKRFFSLQFSKSSSPQPIMSRFIFDEINAQQKYFIPLPNGKLLTSYLIASLNKTRLQNDLRFIVWNFGTTNWHQSKSTLITDIKADFRSFLPSIVSDRIVALLSKTILSSNAVSVANRIEEDYLDQLGPGVYDYNESEMAEIQQAAIEDMDAYASPDWTNDNCQSVLIPNGKLLNYEWQAISTFSIDDLSDQGSQDVVGIDGTIVSIDDNLTMYSAPTSSFYTFQMGAQSRRAAPTYQSTITVNASIRPDTLLQIPNTNLVAALTKRSQYAAPYYLVVFNKETGVLVSRQIPGDFSGELKTSGGILTISDEYKNILKFSVSSDITTQEISLTEVARYVAVAGSFHPVHLPHNFTGVFNLSEGSYDLDVYSDPTSTLETSESLYSNTLTSTINVQLRVAFIEHTSDESFNLYSTVQNFPNGTSHGSFGTVVNYASGVALGSDGSIAIRHTPIASTKVQISKTADVTTLFGRDGTANYSYSITTTIPGMELVHFFSDRVGLSEVGEDPVFVSIPSD